MNAISKDAPQVATSRITRAVSAVAVSTVLVAGLAGCMTGRVAPTDPKVVEQPGAPTGIDRSMPADRIAEQLERQAAGKKTESHRRFAGQSADRIAEQLERESQTTKPDSLGFLDHRPGLRVNRIR